MSATPRKHVYIYDHPESKIQFLEETLHGKDWRASLVYPDNTAEERTNLNEARTRFEEKGYIVKSGTNEFGQQVLDVHHLGEGSKPSNVIREMGLAKGVGHLIAHPSMPLAAGLDAGQKSLNYISHATRDPAHLNGLIYLAAEGFLFQPAKGQKLSEPRNFLRSLAFLLFLSQSVTYLFIAKNNDDTAFDEFKKKITNTVKHGEALTDVHFDPATDKPPQSIGHSLVRMLRHYPIQAGALFNNLGMFSYVASSVFEKKHAAGIEAMGRSVAGAEAFDQAVSYREKGFGKDIAGAAASIFSWTVMMLPAKKKEEEYEQNATKNPFARSWNALRENPQFVTGLGTLGASAYRLAGSKVRKNVKQGIGERIYIGGDIMLMFTHSDHYGSKTGNVDKLADTLSEYINTMPMLLGSQSQQQMVQNMADFVLNKGLAEIADSPKNAAFTVDELKERAAMLKLEVGRRVRNSYNEQMEQLGDISARLISSFPNAQRPAVIEQMSKALSDMPWVYASPEEIKTVLDTAMRHAAVAKDVITVADKKAVQQGIADVVTIISRIDKGSSAARLYDALQSFIGPVVESPATKVTEIKKQPQRNVPATSLPPAQSASHVSRLDVGAPMELTRA